MLLLLLLTFHISKATGVRVSHLGLLRGGAFALCVVQVYNHG
jgi:hypothetical protein